MSLQIGPGRPDDNHYNPHEIGEQPTVPKKNQNVVKERIISHSELYPQADCSLQLLWSSSFLVSHAKSS